MSYRLIDANALNGVISNDDYEKVLNAPCIFADLPKGLDGEHYNLQEPVIDKIRERVELEKRGYPPSAGYYKAIMKVLQFIDEYKEESEE